MFWTLIAAIVAGFAGAGIGMVLRHLTRKRLPKGIIPVAAGAGMLIATVSVEYGWYSSVLDTMAEDLVVISEREQQAWYQPWTYVRPWVKGFIGYSPSETVETATGSGILAVQVRIQERWQPQTVLPVLIDCRRDRRAELTPDLEFTDDGQPIDAPWRAVGQADPILNAVCEREAPGT